jgi:hypothetical protein
MHRVLAWALLRPWGLHSSSGRADGPLNRPEEDEVVGLQLPNAARGLLRHWRVLDEAAAAAAAAGHGHQPFAQTLHGLLAAGAPLDPTALPLGLYPTSPTEGPGRGISDGGIDTEAKRWLVQGVSALQAAGPLPWALVGGAAAPSQAQGDAAVRGLAATLFQRLATPPAPGSPPPSPAARRLAGSVLFLAVALELPLVPSTAEAEAAAAGAGADASPTDSLLGALLDARPCHASGAGPTRGEALQRRFGPEVAEALVVAPAGRACLGRLMAQPGRRAQGLVLGVWDWLLARPAFLDAETAEVLRLALDPAAVLLPAAPQALTGDEAAAVRALTVFRRLLRLDASLPEAKRVGVGRDPRVRGAVAALVRGPQASVNVKVGAIELLPFVLPPGVGDGAAAGAGAGGDDEE